MNQTQAQNEIQELIKKFHNRIGGKAARRQHAPAKHQIATLTDLNIINLMPADFGHGDAKIIIEAAQDEGDKFVGLSGSDDWTTTNSSDLATIITVNETPTLVAYLSSFNWTTGRSS